MNMGTTEMEAKLTDSCSFDSQEKSSNCCYHAAGSFCTGCALCIALPLAVAWCIIKSPCKIRGYASKAMEKTMCCGSRKKVYAMHSSFSDIDSDSLSEKLSKAKPPRAQKSRIRNGCCQ